MVKAKRKSKKISQKKYGRKNSISSKTVPTKKRRYRKKTKRNNEIQPKLTKLTVPKGKTQNKSTFFSNAKNDLNLSSIQLAGKPQSTDIKAYLNTLKLLRVKTKIEISKENVMKELQNQKQSELKKEVLRRSEAQGYLFYPQGKLLTNWVLLQDAHTFNEKDVKYNVFIHNTKVPGNNVNAMINSPGCVNISGAEVGPVENKGMIFQNERHLTAKIWCGTSSTVHLVVL